MNITDTKDVIERIDRLVRLRATGTPRELALRLNLSERTVFRILNQMKEIGCPIYFNKASGSYCYEQEGKLLFKFKVTKNELDSKIKNGGGKHLKVFFRLTGGVSVAI
jgi:predicted DNA-binding transcriptional regulator YafY